MGFHFALQLNLLLILERGQDSERERKEIKNREETECRYYYRGVVGWRNFAEVIG